MDPDLLRNYRNRWQAVAAIERAEQRATSLEQRWEQLNYLYLLGRILADRGEDQVKIILRTNQEEETVWRRWMKLKSGL